MFEDIIGDLRLIEVLFSDGNWRLFRMKNIKPYFYFRYVDRPKDLWVAEGVPFEDGTHGWAVIASPVKEEYVRRHIKGPVR